MTRVSASVVPKVQLIETDGVPLESPWHLAAILLLMECVRFRLRGRTDFFVGGNMFLYYSEEQARNLDYRGPDFFFVDGVDGTRPRKWWAIWEEGGRFPDVIMELLSPTTAKHDLTTKKRLYEKTFRTPEYFCCNPDNNSLMGWRLSRRGRYERIRPNEKGWLWCEGLGLWIGLWKGERLGVEGLFPRFYDAQGRLIPNPSEAEKQRADRAEAELAKIKTRRASGDGKSS